MTRIKWVRNNDGSQTTADGRFTVGLVSRNPKWSGYVILTDTTTGREYPSRTEASAKAGARNILKLGYRPVTPVNPLNGAGLVT